jgi:hypothetical protein
MNDPNHHWQTNPDGRGETCGRCGVRRYIRKDLNDPKKTPWAMRRDCPMSYLYPHIKAASYDEPRCRPDEYKIGI